jgi:medium-chain acyl-[acyl-carrier-protein] hydrolase
MTGRRFLRPDPARRARLRLVCFPFAGGGSALYYPWGRDLPAGVEVCPVHLPGREDRIGEPPLARIEPLVEALAEEFRGQGTTPYAFFGHSLGGLVAFELARRLRGLSATGPVHLFVSATRAPQRPGARPAMHHLDDARFLAEIQRRYQAIPAAVLSEPELMALLLPALRADFAMFDHYTYRPEEPLDLPISALGGRDDPEVGTDDLRGWRDQTRGPFSLRIFDGDHFYLREARAPLLRAIADDLAPWLA